MAFNITGAATVTDVRDGSSAPTVTLSNENHTFVAGSDGAIPGGDLSGFSTVVQVYVGGIQYTATAGTPTGTQFRIGGASPNPSSANITVTPNNTDGTIAITDAGSSTQGFVDGTNVNSFTINVPVTIAGIQGTINRTITIGKSIGGDAPITRVVSNTQTIRYDQTRTTLATNQSNISLDAAFFNNDGSTATWAYRSGTTGNFTTITNATSGATVGAIFNTSANLILTAAAYNTLVGSNDVLTIRITKNGQSDQISIAKLAAGDQAATVVVTPVVGSTILRSDTAIVVLEAQVYLGGTLTSPGNDWSFSWAKDGVTLTSGNQAAMTGATQQTNEGFQNARLRIEGDGIADNTASLFSCNVIDPS